MVSVRGGGLYLMVGCMSIGEGGSGCAEVSLAEYLCCPTFLRHGALTALLLPQRPLLRMRALASCKFKAQVICCYANLNLPLELWNQEAMVLFISEHLKVAHITSHKKKKITLVITPVGSNN